MIEQITFIADLSVIIICVVMGTCFIAFPIPEYEEVKNYKISLRTLSFAYFTFAILSTISLLLNIEKINIQVFPFIAIVIASSQAMLFTFTLITLLNFKFVKAKTIINYSSPILFISILYAISYWIFGDINIKNFKELFSNIDHPTVIIRLINFLIYLAQLIYFPYIFFRENKKSKENINNFFSENITVKLKWVVLAFISALVIGIIAILLCIFNNNIFYLVFTIIYGLFYFMFAIQYIRYQNIFKIIVPITNQQSIEDKSVTLNSKNWEYYRNKVINEKYYLKIGVNIEEMAIWLGIGRTKLSNYINSEEKMNFNTWINKLRIEDAKSIMIENPDLSIARISEMVGFSEQSNFSRQFKSIASESPITWRQKQQKTIKK